MDETITTSAKFRINNARLYVPVATLSINDNIKFLWNINQGFKRTIYWNKYRFERKTQSQNNNLDFLIDPKFRNTNRLFVLSFKNSDDHSRKNSFDECYMPLAEIEVFNALINIKPLFDQPVKNKQEP